MSKKKQQEPAPVQYERFRLSEMEYFFLTRCYLNDTIGMVISPPVNREFEQAWERPESYPFRKTDPEEPPAIGIVVELTPL